jgi:hypothetical protein
MRKAGLKVVELSELSGCVEGGLCRSPNMRSAEPTVVNPFRCNNEYARTKRRSSLR